MGQEGKADRIDPITGAKVGEYIDEVVHESKSSGLLEKAAERSKSPTPVAIVAEEPGKEEEGPVVEAAGLVEALKTVALFGFLPVFLTRILLVYLPGDELTIPVIGASLVMSFVFLLSLSAVMWRLRIFSITSSGFAVSGTSALATSVVAISYLTMLILPLILGVALEGELSVGQVEYSEDGESITVKVLQNTISDRDIEASIVILQSGQQVWSSTANFSIDSGKGEGEIIILVDDFYSTNALPDSPYTLELTIDGEESTRDLTFSQITWDTTQWTGADALSRDITGVDGLATGVVKEDPDRCSGDADNCLVGVVMSGWSGLDTGADKPARMPFADYTVEAVLMEGNDVAIAYPIITVSNTEASWDSEGGIFGTGTGTWGEYGSEFTMDGSIFDATFGKYVPRDEFDSAGDYGCYSFTMTVTQGESQISDTSYYDYSTSNSNDIWEAVSVC
tara:strand:+ start:109 stop:1461 length:1353 start_codon:yes stop_codon:yes gene_type:complete